ncbi:DUF885 domain-containing protein [Congregibacter variabilis]|uniref:DUF885 domain-containing protein n=1 Tax=Congregibacter variabilis TaxID=3081200 RepID=A0ABZ0I4Q8_9GAMM|nr:DUF885 domain-containing protein [Congregibacter sp. IMCC43200]
MKILLALPIAALFASCASDQDNPLVADSGFAMPAIEHCNTDLRYLNQVAGWQGAWPSRWQGIVAAGPDNADEFIEYWSSASRALADSKARLRQGVRREETAPRAVVLRIHQQVADLSNELSQTNSKYTFPNSDHENAQAWNKLIRKSVAPAVADFEAFLQDEYLPEAQVSPSLSAIKGGETCFANAVTWWTSLVISQDEIERLGWKYINETRAELVKTGSNGESLKAILSRLRQSEKNDETTIDELLDVSESALARAHANTQLAFSKQATHEIAVTKLPLHMQSSFPAGRYLAASEHAPAQYVINPSRPNERRLMAEVIAFHEAIPGHHLWAAYPRDTPVEKYTSGLSGITEGWAIYSEYVADEMGLYSSTYDRQGMMAKHLWAASRLVVEPGLHLRGWSREQAVSFMLENTLMSRTEIELEVDRYIAMPGQSLSYILGANLLLSERQRAREQMGTAFDVRAFHDVVLAAGARPLPIVRDDIRKWSESNH